MNKTIIININGIVFHIDEDAYDLLRKYLSDVKQHFAYSEDSAEIVGDIESRIAEMFNERLAEQNKQVIVYTDVQDIVARMGTVNDFDTETSSQEFEPPYFANQSKLYRDVDNKLVSGVCAGLSHYFKVDVTVVRILAILITLMWGTGLIVYLVLMFIIPKATTRAEKMAMRGEAINLQNFKKSFDEEMDSLKENLQTTHQRLKPGLNKAVDYAGRGAGLLVKIVGIGVVFICSAILLGSLLAAIFWLGFGNSAQLNFPMNGIVEEYKTPLVICGLLLGAIPALALLLFALRVVTNRPVAGRVTYFALLVLWIVGLGVTVYYASQVKAEFNEEAKMEQINTLKLQKTYIIRINSARHFSSKDSIKYNIGNARIKGSLDLDDDFGQIRLEILRSTDSTATLTKELSAKGRNFEEALKTVQKSAYNFVQTDSILTLDQYLYLADKAPYRNQRLNLTLRVPVNTRIVVEGDTRHFLQNFNVNDCLPPESEWNNPAELVMRPEGLKCDTLYKKEEPLTN